MTVPLFIIAVKTVQILIVLFGLSCFKYVCKFIHNISVKLGQVNILNWGSLDAYNYMALTSIWNGQAISYSLIVIPNLVHFFVGDNFGIF